MRSSFCALALLVSAASLGGEVEVLFEKAERARKEKRSEEALALFRDLLKKAPDHLEGNLGYQKVLQSQGKEPELVKEYEKLAEKTPEPWALFLLGRVLHDPPREEALYRRALEKSPGDFRCRMALGYALERQSRSAEAEKEYREAARLEPDSLDPHRSLMDLFEKGGRIGELLSEYRERAEKSGDDWRAQLLYGRALGTARDWDGCRRRLERARELAPRESGVLVSIAVYHLKRNEPDPAQGILEDLLREDPFNAQALLLHGMLKALPRRDPGGLSLLEEAIRLEPGESDDQCQLGAARSLHRDFPGAETAFKEALRLNGANALAMSNLGVLCMGRREFPQALEWFEKAIRSRPKTAEYHTGLAEACEKLGFHDRAREERQAAEKLHREADFIFRVAEGRRDVLDQSLARARDLVALAATLVIAGRFDEGTARFEESIRAAPDFDQAYWRLARVQRRLGKPGDALSVYSRLQASYEKQKRPAEDLADVLWAMAECRYDLGERPEAIRLWRAARDMLPDGKARGHLDELVRKLETQDPNAEVFRIEGLRIPECTRPNWCAPRSIAAVLSYWKIPAVLEDLAAEMGAAEGDGAVTFAALMRALERRPDVKAVCFSFQTALVKGLLKKGYPVIWFGGGHATVVAGFDDRRGVFQLEDSNWFEGRDQLYFADAGRGILIAPPAEFDPIVETLPDRRYWDLVNRAEALVDTNGPEARTLLEEAVKLRPDEYLSQLYLGYVQEAEGRFDAALETYRRAADLPGADARVESQMAGVLLRTRKVEEAEKVLQEGLKKEPKYAPLSATLLEIAWKERKDPAQALTHCDRLLALVPDKGKLLFVKGEILVALDRHQEAIEALAWAANAGGPPEANLRLGQLLRAKGDRRRAIEVLLKYASQVKDQDEAEKARQTVEEIRKEEKAKGR